MRFPILPIVVIICLVPSILAAAPEVPVFGPLEAEAARSPRWLAENNDKVQVSVGPAEGQTMEVSRDNLQRYYGALSAQQEYELQRLSNWWQGNRFHQVRPELRDNNRGIDYEVWLVHYADFERARGPQFDPTETKPPISRPQGQAKPNSRAAPWGLSILSIEF